MKRKYEKEGNILQTLQYDSQAGMSVGGGNIRLSGIEKNEIIFEGKSWVPETYQSFIFRTNEELYDQFDKISTKIKEPHFPWKLKDLSSWVKEAIKV